MSLISWWKLDGNADDSLGINNGTLSSPTVLNTLDDTSHVTSVQTATFSTNTTTFQEDSALNIYRVTPDTANNLGWDMHFTEQGLIHKKVNVYLYFKDQATVDKVTDLKFYIHGRLDLLGGNDGWNAYTEGEALASPEVGWNVYTLDADNPDTIESDGADLTTCDKVRFRVYHNTGLIEWNEGDVICDYMTIDTPYKTKNRNDEDNKAYHFFDDGNIRTPARETDKMTGISISAWAKVDILESYHSIFDNENYAGGGIKDGWTIRINDNGSFHFSIGETITNPTGENDTITSDSGLIQVGTWYHYVATWDGLTMRIYLNGEFLKSVAYSGIIPNTGKTWTIGGLRDDRNMKGSISDVRVYDDALSQEDITTLFNGNLLSINKLRSPNAGQYAKTRMARALK